ncbi:MAG: endonuclease MutS2 [Treponema sp.]|jgi:DNA mismatch repair protein MutS2|nr:endonuclease MutS2 [Treponema sp.]
MSDFSLKTLGLLEFDAIRKRVADRAVSEEAARRVLEDLPLRDSESVGRLKTQVNAILERINSSDEEKRDSIPDIGFLLPKLAIEGTALELDEAYALAVFVERGLVLKTWIAKTSEIGLREWCLAAPDCAAIPRDVFRVLDREGRLRDLPEFAEINRRIRKLTHDLDAVISRYTQDEDSRRMLQSTVPSQRDGRVVLALKVNFRGRVKGIVHEVSASGQTLFVEPTEVVERNNDILIERRRLDAEILRVLREMTNRIAEHRVDLEKFHELIISIETLHARARYAYETRGHFALEGNVLWLKQARHPLLGTSAVPIDFSMSGDINTVIITGPNTGGKTVGLKTVGLFALMNQFGLALPSDQDPILPVFDGVYADIGDEQSLSQSLSTFSAHMTNISSIINAATDKSLVLLDELGSGTDPEEGSAIAMAILDHFIEKQVRLITTTHHGILKNYGYTRARVENASVEFDGRTLSPTFRIVMGLPGESRAVDIAARNGLQPDIVSRARAYLADERSDVSALIAGLKKKHEELDAGESARRLEEQRLREERRKIDLKELRVKQKELEIKAGETGKLKRLLEESRKTLENLVREVKEGELTREKTLKVKDFLHELEQSAAGADAAIDAERRALLEAQQSIATENDAEDLDKASSGGKAKQAKLHGKPRIMPGTEVLAGEYQRRGTVLRADKKDSWIVEIGSLKISFQEQDLIPLMPSTEAKKPIISTPDLVSSANPQFELNLRGMRVEEALETLQYQLDAAVLSGLRGFSVVHGKGDGILQKAVHDFLKTQSVVADYYFSRPEHGGFGRTEVALK